MYLNISNQIENIYQNGKLANIIKIVTKLKVISSLLYVAENI